MKKIKSLITVFASLMIVFSFATSLATSAANRKVLYASIEPQEEDYYCGVASLQALLKNEYRHDWRGLIPDARGYMPQRGPEGTVDIRYLLKHYINYDVDAEGEVAWFTGSDNSQASDISCNPLCKLLNKITAYNWRFLGPRTRTGSFDAATLRSVIKTSIDNGHCVLLDGLTLIYANNRYYRLNYSVMQGLTGTERVKYPATKGHWVLIDGYEDGGKTFTVRDPAWHGKNCSDWDNVGNVYRINTDDLMNFIGSKGIIYAIN